MRWDDMRESDNVDDQRGNSASNFGGMGGGGLLPLLFSLLGNKYGLILVGIGIAVMLVTGKNPLQLLTGAAPQAQRTTQTTATANDEGLRFVKSILGDTEDVWGQIYQQAGSQYQAPRLVLFRGAVNSGCGRATSAVGPFYCGADQKVYLDLDFFEELKTRFGAPGDFAQAYVIAHEVGHHVQNIMGTSGQVHAQQQRVSKVEGNKLSVRLELQADCYAGVWGHYAQQRNLLEAGDIEEGLKAAHAIGDDTLQKHAQGHVVPDSFTHGSAAQRQHWFTVGLKTGDVQQCDTFKQAI